MKQHLECRQRRGPSVLLVLLMTLSYACGKDDAPGTGPGSGTSSAETAPAATPASPAQASPVPAAPFVPVSLQSVRTGQQPSSARVQVELFLLTHSIIRTRHNKEPERYFMLAVDQESQHAKAVDELERDANKLAKDIAVRLKKKQGRAFQKALNELIPRFTALNDRLKSLKPDPKEAIAVELDSEGLKRLVVSWSTLVDECEGPGCMPQLRTPGDSLFQDLFAGKKSRSELGFGFTPPPPTFDPCEEPLVTREQLKCLADKDSQLARMKAQDPPQLEESMPTLPKIHSFAEERVILRYNAVVGRFNAELLRRQKALAQVMPSYVERLARLAAMLRGPKVTIHGVVAPLPELARRSYTQMLGVSPTKSLRELGEGKETFASTFYEKARYCITSYPPGAEITFKGESVGRTPRCLDDVPFGRLFEITVKRAEYAPVGLGPRRMEPSPDGVFEIHCTLHKAADAGSGCKIL
jgi:hypothetical protein